MLFLLARGAGDCGGSGLGSQPVYLPRISAVQSPRHRMKAKLLYRRLTCHPRGVRPYGAEAVKRVRRHAVEVQSVLRLKPSKSHVLAHPKPCRLNQTLLGNGCSPIDFTTASFGCCLSVCGRGANFWLHFLHAFCRLASCTCTALLSHVTETVLQDVDLLSGANTGTMGS
ncbi:hypothetical protein PVAP13_5KG106461 [Panicum virgatum]|uniref:Uncharacterized protein n=1 Tax=Panicum virgatum TaxID=38727 RepID=A0A8T0SFP9_PANVG|nr:hypothetical protein PVAP13_5KG106461 [Panicum virgatum]KAG2595839.1 hypothetical protein PVAP13_5KG106461 [Panicum virgatum]